MTNHNQNWLVGHALNTLCCSFHFDIDGFLPIVKVAESADQFGLIRGLDGDWRDGGGGGVAREGEGNGYWFKKAS